MKDVVLVAFADLAGARRGLAELRRLEDEDRLALRAAEIAVREPDGRFRIPEDEQRVGYAGTATGGVVGALVGALVGPLGLLVLGATGALVGSVIDADEAEVSEGILSNLIRSIPPGTAAIVADIDERSPEELDAVMEDVGGTVTRWRRADLEAGLAAAEEEAPSAARRDT